MKKICFDAVPKLYEGGISNYVIPFFETLNNNRYNNFQQYAFYRCGKKSRFKNFLEIKDNNLGTSKVTRFPDRVLEKIWNYGFLSPLNKLNKDTVFISTTEMVPKSKSAKIGQIVYDLTPARIPQFYSGDPKNTINDYKEKFRRCDFLICISKSTLQDIVDLTGFSKDRMVVVYPGIENYTCNNFVNPYVHHKPYLCYLGSLSKSKNVDGMLRVFSRCVHEYNLDLDFILTGKDFFGKEYWENFLGELNIQNRVHIKGWVSDIERLAILKGAKMLWHFSWYEGFGFPVLEAAYYGIPVLYSNRGSLPEIIVNKHQEIDPSNENDTIQKAISILNNQSLLATWSKNGQLRAKTFTWKNSIMNFIQWMSERNLL